ncbi:hypothetical protein [uncultured Mitsuokella sp.]|uniref:hypothetical protein n=1 Tax=uncultured Mitsuokella sp. TaxID=453120 RepID=UPI0026709413|nr:hypothetical protein [uncultured Mitsuokella sp.]
MEKDCRCRLPAARDFKTFVTPKMNGFVAIHCGIKAPGRFLRDCGRSEVCLAQLGQKNKQADGKK